MLRNGILTATHRIRCKPVGRRFESCTSRQDKRCKGLEVIASTTGSALVEVALELQRPSVMGRPT